MAPKTRSQTPVASTPNSPLSVPAHSSTENRDRSPSVVNRKEALALAFVIPSLLPFPASGPPFADLFYTLFGMYAVPSRRRTSSCLCPTLSVSPFVFNPSLSGGGRPALLSLPSSLLHSFLRVPASSLKLTPRSPWVSSCRLCANHPRCHLAGGDAVSSQDLYGSLLHLLHPRRRRWKGSSCARSDIQVWSRPGYGYRQVSHLCLPFIL